MKIDIHTHAFPADYIKIFEKYSGHPPPFLKQWEWNADIFLGEMDQWDVDVKVLSLSGPSVYFDDLAMSRELARVSNDSYGEICARWPKRFKMFASLPVADPDAECRELERVRSLPGYAGLAIGSNIAGKMLDDPLFGGFFEYANDSQAVFFVHPMGYPLPEEWTRYRLGHLIGWPIDTTFSVSRLVLGGFFDKYPNLRLIAAHVGGAIPYLSVRLERGYKDGCSKHKPSYYFQNHIFYDTAGPTHEAIIECVVKMYGAERVLFGTDYPFGTGQEGMQYTEKAIWNVENARLSKFDAEKIFAGNVKELLKIEA